MGLTLHSFCPSGPVTPTGITRAPLCWCALWSPPSCRGTCGARACGTPISWPPSCGTPSPWTSPGWSTAPPTCTATAPTTRTSTPGRTPWSPWEPSVSAQLCKLRGMSQPLAPCLGLWVPAAGRRLEARFGGGRSLCILGEGSLVLVMVPTLKKCHVISGRGGVSTQQPALLSR